MTRSLLLSAACLLFAARASAQEEAVRTIPFAGPEVFCHVLQYEGLQPLANVNDLLADPKQSLLIVFGSLGGTTAILDKIKQFESQGGNTLIATDREQAFSHRPIRITGRSALQFDVAQAYRGHRDCPTISVAEGRGHPIFQLVHKPIALNCPSYMEISEPARRSLYVIPYDDGGRGLNPRDQCLLAGAPKDAPPAGRALFIAGHGLFMNGMMLQSDNDNFLFAINVVRWLREAPGGTKRTQALFLVDGEVIANFDVNLTPPPIMPVPPIKAIDRLLHGLQKERFFHRVLDRLLGDYRDTVLHMLLAGVTFLLVLYAAKKLMEGRFLLETAAPRMVGVVPSLVSAAPATEQRPNAFFRQADLSHEARLLARAWFWQEFRVAPEQWSADMPMAFQVKGWFWTRRSIHRQANRALQRASATETAPLTRRDFARLLRSLTRLSNARRAGRLTLLATDKTVRYQTSRSP